MQKLILALFLFPLLLACQADQTSGTIELDQGEKWLVNEEMKPHILKGEAILQQYQTQNDTDHQALAAALKEQNGQLINSCTMKGKSHEELHKWLHPHMELIAALSQASSLEEAQPIVLQIEQSFQTYHHYFK